MNPPRTAYILLWFPKPSETFIFREVMNLRRMGLPVKVYTLYGALKKNLSPEMLEVNGLPQRLGVPWLKHAFADVRRRGRMNPWEVSSLFREIPVRRWRSPEVAGENLWAFFCGFTLAGLFETDRMEHIHAPWANGPATAAWVASRLTGIPFSFSARAVDIYPPDGALREKIRDAALVRTNTMNNVAYLQNFCEKDDHHKIRLTYNGLPLTDTTEAPAPMDPPYNILAMGRFARFKGFDVLIKAAAVLKRRGFDFRLTIAGAGAGGVRLKFMTMVLGLRDRVFFPGFVRHDMVSEFYRAADLFVMPSIVHRTGERDGIPNVILEALLHRLPVISTAVSGIGEVITDGVTGYLAAPGDPSSLAEAVIRVTSDRESAIRTASAGRERVMAMFDPETNHRRVLEMYAET